MIPILIMPPMTPVKINGSGRSAPFRIRTGRMTWSIVMDTSAKTRRIHPERVDPVWNSQITAGIMTSAGPSCARHKIRLPPRAAGRPESMRSGARLQR